MRRTRSKCSPKTTRSSPNRKSDFGALAAHYDELRDVEPRRVEELNELLVREGDLRGRRVLDVGCGTGTLAAWLAERAAAKVWGVDESPEMLDVARAKVPDGVGLKLGRAEQLPFKDGWFERAVSMLVIHHLDRTRAFPEVRRVLSAGGRFAIATFDASYFPHYYLNRYFPSFLEIDSARFPTAEALDEDLRAAGFDDVRAARLTQQVTISRGKALERIRGRHISTFQLISDEEYRAGLAFAERELPERIDYEQHWLVVSASVE